MFLFAFFLASCAKEPPIQFSPEHMATLVNRPDTLAPRPAKPKQQGLSKTDTFSIETIVYGNLLQRHPWEDIGLAAVFVQGDDDEVDALIRQFPNNVPPIKRSASADLQPGRAPLDKDTGKPAIILSVDIMTGSATNAAQAIGKWFAGSATSGTNTYELGKTNSSWLIQSFK